MGIEIPAVLVIAIVRLGVPLLAIIVLSYAAYRYLGRDKLPAKVAEEAVRKERAATAGPAAVAHLMYAEVGTHCWDAHHCTPEMKAKCPAVARPELPCWLAVQMKTGHLKEKCFDCSYYDRPVSAG